MSPLPATVPETQGVNPALIQRMYAKDCSQDEFVVFLTLAQKYGLDPSLKQIWAIKYPGGGPATIIVSRDGLLEIAHRDGMFDGLESGTDGSVQDGNLTGWCKVYRKDMSHPFTVTVHYDEYVQKKKSGEITKFWKEKPRTMIAKVAEAQTLRKAFRVQGLYSEDEMPAEPKEIPDTSVPIVDVSANACVSCGNMINPEHIAGILEKTGGVPMCDACFSDWYRKECAEKEQQIAKAQKAKAEVKPPKPEPKPQSAPEKPKNTCQLCGKEVPAGATHCMDCVTAENGKPPEKEDPVEAEPAPEPIAQPEPANGGPVCEHCGKQTTPKDEFIAKTFNAGRMLCHDCQGKAQRGEI